MNPKSPWAGVIENLRRAASPHGRAQLGQFSVEGVRLLERAVRAGTPPTHVVISDRELRHGPERTHKLLADLALTECELITVPEGVILELAGGREESTLFGLCPIPTPPRIEDMILRAQQEGGTVLVVLDVEEPGNVGALVRTALASGATGVITAGVSDAYHPKAVRTSMGSLFKVPILKSFEVEPVIEQLSELRRLGAVSTGGVAPWELKPNTPSALFVGSEANGLPDNVVDVLDERITIPMPSGVDSFSVNAAAAVVMYELQRPRQA